MGRKGGCAQIAPWPRPADNDRERGQEQRWGNDNMMTCVQLALTAQLICFSDHTFVCTDNGSLAHLSASPPALGLTGDEFQTNAI